MAKSLNMGSKGSKGLIELSIYTHIQGGVGILVAKVSEI